MSHGLGTCRGYDLTKLHKQELAGVAQLARASAFQAEGRGFEARLPLQFFNAKSASFCRRLQAFTVTFLQTPFQLSVR